MGGISCGFGRIRSRPAKNINGAKKVAYYPKIQYSARSFLRCLALLLFLNSNSN
jgi:hypothetical protein